MRYLKIAAFVSLLYLPAAAQKPAPDEQHRTIDAAREIAVHYTGKLPDFICHEQVERTDGYLSKRKVDKLTIELTYFGQKEKQKLLTINGNQASQPLESLEGLITGGEFGSLLLGIFDPSSAADFQWKEAASLRKRRAAVYTYRIARAHSHYMVGSRGADGQLASLPAGYKGEVWLDAENNHVLRLTAAADDIPKDSGIIQSSVEVDYDFVQVAGANHLLPAHSTAHMERSYRQITNAVNFVDYRKFEADSTISFK